MNLFDASAIINLCGEKKLDKLLQGWTLNLALRKLGIRADDTLVFSISLYSSVCVKRRPPSNACGRTNLCLRWLKELPLTANSLREAETYQRLMFLIQVLRFIHGLENFIRPEICNLLGEPNKWRKVELDRKANFFHQKKLEKN